MKTKRPFAKLTTLAGLSLSLASANAAVVFFDDFENGINSSSYPATSGSYTNTPDVSAAQSTGNTSGSTNTTLWVRSTSGFGAGRSGLVDESAGAFTDPVGSQAYAFRYTNSGLTSNSGMIGSLTVGQTITVTFDVVMDTAATPYEAGLVLFNGGARNAVESFDKNTSAVLAKVIGNAPGTGAYQTISFSYTVGENVVDNNGGGGGTSTVWDNGLLGQDIAIRFKGASTSANIDNVSINVTVIPEPRAALLGGLGLLALLRRRR